MARCYSAGAVAWIAQIGGAQMRSLGFSKATWIVAFYALFAVHGAAAQPPSPVKAYLTRHAQAASCQVTADGAACTGVSAKDVSEGYRLLEAAVRNPSSQPPPPITEIVQLTIFLLKYDPSNYASEVIHPFCRIHAPKCNEALLKQPPADRELFELGIESFLREQREGNG